MCAADSTTKANVGLSAAKRALLLAKLQQRKGTGASGDAIARRAERTTVALSYVQERMWFLEQLNPGDPVYNRPCSTRITGAVDPGLLQLSLQATVTRHEILRTTFSSADGIPFQVVHPAAVLPISQAD